MKVWQTDKLKTLQFVDNDRTMFQKIVEWSKELGFDYCTIALRVPIPLFNPPIFAATNFPEAWQAIYARNHYYDIDPVVKRALRSEEIFVWTDDLFLETPEFWKGAQEAGLRYGLAIPTRGNHGVAGVLTLARTSREILPREFADIEFKLAWLGQIAHQGMSKYLALNSTIARKLSKREISVLRWTAEGKTASAIAEILNISERTVNFHSNNAIEKLDVPNKTAAAVQAALLGLLS